MVENQPELSSRSGKERTLISRCSMNCSRTLRMYSKLMASSAFDELEDLPDDASGSALSAKGVRAPFVSSVGEVIPEKSVHRVNADDRSESGSEAHSPRPKCVACLT